MPTFTRQSSMLYPDHWLQWLGRFVGQSCHGLEVGCYEGRSTLWFIDNICTHERARMVAVDWFKGNDDAVEAALNRSQRELFDANLAAHLGTKLHWVLPEKSSVALPSLISKYCMFDWIYIDGSHDAIDVLSDSVFSWQLLKTGGVLFWDDYDNDRFTGVKTAIDSFLACHEGKYKGLHCGSQVAVEKL